MHSILFCVILCITSLLFLVALSLLLSRSLILSLRPQITSDWSIILETGKRECNQILSFFVGLMSFHKTLLWPKLLFSEKKEDTNILSFVRLPVNIRISLNVPEMRLYWGWDKYIFLIHNEDPQDVLKFPSTVKQDLFNLKLENLTNHINISN